MIIAVDPGLTTGYATLTPGESTPAAGELAFGPFVNLLEDLAANAADPLTCVIEKFIINQNTAKNSQAPWSLEVIGVVRSACARYGLPEPYFQTPTAAKSFVPNDKLKALGWRQRGGGGHHNDALRHLVLYLVDQCGWRDPRALGIS